MKLKKGFCTQTISDGQVMVPTAEADTDFRGIVRNNETAAFVVDLLKNDTTEEKILDALKSEYDGDEDKMRSDLRTVLNKLREIKAIDE